MKTEPMLNILYMFFVFAWLFLLPSFAQADVQVLKQINVEYLYSFNIGVESSDADLQLLENTNVKKLVDLPHAWSSFYPQLEGVYVYTADLKAPQSSESTSIYIPRIGNRYKIHLNNVLLLSTGSLFNNHFDYAHLPVIIDVPNVLLKPNHNTLQIFVVGEKNRFAGLSTIYIGDSSELRSRYESQYFFQVFSTWGLIVVCITIALMAWLVSYYSKNWRLVIFGFGAFFWALRTSFLIIDYVPFDYRLLLFLFDFLYGLAVTCLVINIVIVCKLRTVWLLNVIYAFIAISVLLPLCFAFGLPYARFCFLVCMLVLVFVTLFEYIKKLIKNPKNESYVLLPAFVLAAVFGLYDLMVVYQSKQGYELFSISKYSFVAVTIALTVNFGTRLRQLNHLIGINRSRLNRRLNENKIRLNALYDQQIALVRKETLEQERWRMMQDMHDGLGSKLLNLRFAINQVQTQPHVSPSLHEGIDDAISELRMIVNSAYHQHSTVAYMLGDLRDKLEYTCKQSGKMLIWQVDAIPKFGSINSIKINHLEKMVSEIFTNIAKHSTANLITLSANLSKDADSNKVIIDISEEGYELGSYHSTYTLEGKGLSGLVKRAKMIDVEITFLNHFHQIVIAIPAHE
jgi:signal transduction histidine kinase